MMIGRGRTRRQAARRLRFRRLTVAAALFLTTAGGWGLAPITARAEETKSGDEAPVSEEARAEAREIYRARCTLCHGESGKGDGAGATAFDPPPRDLSDSAWQESVVDEYIDKIIVGGGVAVGKSPLMPPNPDLKSRPEVVRALRQLVRGFKGK